MTKARPPRRVCWIAGVLVMNQGDMGEDLIGDHRVTVDPKRDLTHRPGQRE